MSGMLGHRSWRRVNLHTLVLFLFWRSAAGWFGSFARSALVATSLLVGSPESEYNSFASRYDDLDGGTAAEVLGINRLRRLAGEQTRGDVLEIAVGTGLQSSYYNLHSLNTFTGIDLSQSMLSEASQKWNKKPELVAKHPRLQLMDATNLEFSSESFDSVIDTFSFCTFSEPNKVVQEMVRVLKPGGVLVLLENSVSTNPILAALQDASEPIVTPLSKSCRWNVNVPAIVENQGDLLRLIDKRDEQLGTITLRVYTKKP